MHRTDVLHILDRFVQALGEFFEVFLVQKDFVLVVRRFPSVFLPALAFGDGQIKIIALSGFNIKEISPFARFYGL